MRNPECFGFPFGCVAVVAAASVAGLFGSADRHGLSLAALGFVVLVAGAVTSTTAAAGTAVIAWSVHSGFTVGSLGALQFTLETGVAAAVFLGATLTGAAYRGRWVQRATTIATTVVKDPPTFKVSTFRTPSI
ncbi:hypothetical protein [Amycolatopsis sp. BJA-103]|uniref:hypothetical protein n=1 Tax=unclassified Amycolatopsis TaxID=2618356 RepID=UPI000C7661A6|nr:hypothetical protein [Amycolatopsis sp. BJA-103]AUI56935.1 hypothetical protein BKN51_01045 [Amycolatopsis sp. BJA-103]PNE13341.1 hypothetical protein B1H26_41130 [Amycolatopsis sp. BJA-103]